MIFPINNRNRFFNHYIYSLNLICFLERISLTFLLLFSLTGSTSVISLSSFIASLASLASLVFLLALNSAILSLSASICSGVLSFFTLTFLTLVSFGLYIY